MGSGAARELEGPRGELPSLNPELAEKLTQAAAKLDAVDEDFRQSREDERLSQMAKAWQTFCVQIDEYLRLIGDVVIASHQIALEMGSEGGGRGTSPWIEESGRRFKRLYFRLNDDGSVIAEADGHVYASTVIAGVDYPWIEQAVVMWFVASTEKL